MGIPRLFKHFLNTYGNYITTVHTKSPKSLKCTHLFFDANALLHGAAQETFGYGSFPPSLSSDNDTISDNIDVMYETFYERLENIISILSPTEFVYIAIDGVAPLAKQSQQRQRRFISARNRESSETLVFDSNSLSPGTEIMYDLGCFLREQLDRLSKTNNITYYFSDATVPGEGEQKCMDYIRSNYSLLQHKSCVLYGPDGDLLMLGLLTYLPKFSIIREAMVWNNGSFEPNGYHLIDIRGVGRTIHRRLTIGLSKKFNYKDVINDFVLFCFMLGNDFLPKIKAFYLLESGIEIVMDLLSQHYSTRLTTVTRNKQINYKELNAYLVAFTLTEEELIANQLCNSYSNRHTKFIDKTLFESTIVTEDNGELFIELDYPLYKDNYYKDIQDKEKFHKEYLNGLVWVFHYYVDKGCPSERWFFRYHKAPLFKEWIKDIGSYKPLPYPKEHKIPAHPFQQLLSILPSQSKELLPKEFHHLFLNKKIYPVDFEIDYQGKVAEYQGVALLPMVEWEEMNSIYLSVLNEHPELKKNTRNIIGQEYSYGFKKQKKSIRSV